MSRFKRIILPLYFFVCIQSAFSQKLNRENGVPFGIKVEIIDKSDSSTFKNARVMVNGKEFPFDIVREFYPIRAKIGDELIVTHPSIETVYYTVKKREPIRIEIEGSVENQYSKIKSGDDILLDLFKQNLDSAVFYKDKDFDKSSGFIENIIKVNYSNRKKAIAYRLLGDIYFQWKQYDLAASTYNTSLGYDDSEITKYEIAVAYILLNKYDDAEKALKAIKTSRFGTYYTILVSEKLGDVYLAKKEFKNAIKSYNKGLSIAENRKVTPKITDLNSKLGDVFAAEGKIAKANSKFKSSLDLASKEDPVRFIEEEEKVANYFNQTQQFDKEIDLRKQTLLQTKLINDSTLVLNDGLKKKELDSDKVSFGTTLSDDLEINLNQVPGYFNPQSINYKIGRALVQKEEYKEAIPFLENSIKDANTRKDLVVEKDATRKLSEAYSNVGEYDKALDSYQNYVALVDSVYIRKEQEIEQAKRFAQKIVDNQRRIAGLEKDRELTSSKINLAIKDQQLTEERNKNQEVIIYVLIGGMTLMFVLASLLLRSNKQQKLSNNLLALKSMRSQMNPHFIFNALNSVNSFIAENDERNANRYLSEFSVLMRSVLENSDEDFIPFSKEIELLELYVKLEHNRFKDKFNYSISLDESIDTDEYSIPPMLLQPYIENAIWHGLRYKEELGNLDILVKKLDDETISVVVQDDGVGRKKSMELKTKNQLKQKSKGMSTIKKRIEILNDMYQDTIDVQVSDLFEDGTGTKVELTLKRR